MEYIMDLVEVDEQVQVTIVVVEDMIRRRVADTILEVILGILVPLQYLIMMCIVVVDIRVVVVIMQ